MSSTLSGIANLVADYTFAEGAGSSITDVSGNGKTFAITSGTPSWSAQGMICDGSQSGTTPITMDVPRTIISVLTLGTPNPSVSDLNCLYGHTNVGDASDTQMLWNLVGPNGNNSVSQQPGYFTPAVGFGNGTRGPEAFLYPGYPGMVSWLTDPSSGGVDSYYYGDSPSADVIGSPSSQYTRSTSEHLVFGDMVPPLANIGFVGTRNRDAIWSRVLTQQEITAAKGQIYLDALARGIILGRTVNPIAGNVIIFDGDSISAAEGASTVEEAWENQLILNDTYQFFCYAIPGQQVATIDQKFASRRFASLFAPLGKNIYVIFAGTNDGSGSSQEAVAETAFGHLQSVINKALAAGCAPGAVEVVVIPMLSRVALDVYKNDYNALITADYVTSTVAHVHVVPASAMPHLVPDGSYANTTYFNTDQTHPTDAGHAEIAAAVSPVINAITFTAGLPTTLSVSGPSTGATGSVVGPYTIELDGNAPSGGAVVPLMASGASDTFRATSLGSAVSSVTIPAGSNSTTFYAVPSGAGFRNLAINSSNYIVPTTPLPLTVTGMPTLTLSPSGPVTAYVGGPPVAVIATLASSSNALSASETGGATLSTNTPTSGQPFAVTLPSTPATVVVTVADTTDSLTTTLTINVLAVPSGGGGVTGQAPANFLDTIVVETGVNLRQALSAILAASAGVVSGAGSGTVVLKGGNTSTTRISATTDDAGNRSSVTLTLPS